LPSPLRSAQATDVGLTVVDVNEMGGGVAKVGAGPMPAPATNKLNEPAAALAAMVTGMSTLDGGDPLARMTVSPAAV